MLTKNEVKLLKEERENTFKEMAKMKKENEVLKSKVKAYEEEKKKKETETTEEVMEMEEEEEVDEVADALRLMQMKESGREQFQIRNTRLVVEKFPCGKCSKRYASNHGLAMHEREVHGTLSLCPFCQNGFTNLAALKEHISVQHKETKQEEKSTEEKKGRCVFFFQAKGCKKGNNCDRSHEASSVFVKKAPKLCFNGPTCGWKPGCR